MNNTIRGLIGLVVMLAGLHEPETECPPQIDCVAAAIYTEGRSTSFAEQVAIGEVVMQRGNDPCETISKPNQFHGIRDAKKPMSPWNEDPHAWNVALLAAVTAMEGFAKSPCFGSDHFWSGETPSWASNFDVCELGHHTFGRSK